VAYLAFNLIALALLVGFVALTAYEERRGVRLFAQARSGLDARIARIAYVLAHVDLQAFVREELRRTAKRLGHFLVALSLRAVRTIERLLTRLIMYLRTRHPVDAPQGEEARPFVKALSDFKDRLKKKTRKDISDIE
jgi:hypothetical protein